MIPRTVYITGASSGIGRALAIELARRGAHVALAARRAAELERVAEQVRVVGGTATTYVVDVADADAAMDAVRRADQDLGSLDMVIANAGVSAFGHAATTPWSEISRLVDINVKGAMATLVAAIPIMIAHQRGHLVGVSSLAGRRGVPYGAAYSASKAALSAFLDSLRIDLARAKISVTDVQPGFVDTAMYEKGRHPTPMLWSAEKAGRHIVKRLAGSPSVVAFPWPLATLSSVSRMLPSWLYDPVVRVTSGLS